MSAATPRLDSESETGAAETGGETADWGLDHWRAGRTGRQTTVAMSERILTRRLNGVPLRRVSQAYVIATSTKVELGSISIPESVNDAYFAKSKAAKGSKEGEFFGEGKEKKAFPDEKKSEQKVGFGRPSGRGVRGRGTAYGAWEAGESSRRTPRS